MKAIRYSYYILFTVLAFLTACDVHEWPEQEEPQKETIRIDLKFQTDMDEVEHFYETRSVHSTGEYEMRYLLRAFPINTEDDGRTISRTAVWEHVFTRPIEQNDYDTSIQAEIDLPSGEYNLMVWADFVMAGAEENHFYAPEDFTEITIYGEYKANTEMRDAFRGSKEITLTRATLQGGSITVEMERPLAKFTFMTTDLQEFMDKEETAARQRALARGENYTRSINLEDYKVKFQYNGFMPCAYNMFTDKPNDSKIGVSFNSGITVISETEASMGFDYVFVNGTESTVSIVITLYNKEGEELFTSNPIEVPIKRNQHTIMRGKFLTIETSGGVGIVAEFDGEYDYVVNY